MCLETAYDSCSLQLPYFVLRAVSTDIPEATRLPHPFLFFQTGLLPLPAPPPLLPSYSTPLVHAQHEHHSWVNQSSTYPLYSAGNVKTRVGTDHDVHYTRQTTLPLSNSLSPTFDLSTRPYTSYYTLFLILPHPLLALLIRTCHGLARRV